MNLLSGYPFWLIKDGLPYSYPRLDDTLTADVVILGGGISGALVAYYLVNAGINCVVIDARTIGLGSTCASTALLQYEIDTPLHELQHMVGLKHAVRSYELCVEAIDTLKDISKKLSFDQFKSKKSLYYAALKKDISFLKNEFAIRKENGFKVDYLEAEEVSNRFGFDAPAAILSECGAEMDAYAFAHSLHQYSTRKGMKIYDRTPISHIEHSKKGVKLTSESGYRIHAKKLVYATGYEVVDFISKRIVQLHSTYATISEQSNMKSNFWKEDVLIWNTSDPYLYMRSTPDRRILIGGRDEKFFDPVKRDKLINAKKKLLVKDFEKIFPDIEFKSEFTWAGTFGSTKDGLPFIGTYSKLPNSYFALGFGGNGITFSLVAAQILTDLITGKKNSDANIFSFER